MMGARDGNRPGVCRCFVIIVQNGVADSELGSRHQATRSSLDRRVVRHGDLRRDLRKRTGRELASHYTELA